MSLFSLRRFTADFDAPAASGQLDKQLASSRKPSVHLRRVIDTSLVQPYPSLATARAAAFELARRWGQSKRREGGLLFIGEQPRSLAINDLPALNAAVDANTAAIVIDAGCVELSAEYCQAAAQLCRALHILLIIDDRAHAAPLLAERTWGINADMAIVDSDRGPGLPRAAVLVRTHTDGLAAVVNR